MTLDPQSSCELWDLSPPSLPPASRLYCLAPAGLGTPDGESLTSYVVRLAEAHHVSVRALVVHEIRPRLGEAAARATYLNRLTMFWRRDAATLNGTSRVTRAWVQALTDLTQRTDLDGLTMLHWTQVVAAASLLRLSRFWCPACYATQHRMGGIVYDPLLWALAPVTWCVHHECPLQTACPGCGRSGPLLAPHARPGRCAFCGQWLADEALPATATTSPHATTSTAWQVGITEAVGSLIASAPALAADPPRDQITRMVGALVGRMPWRRAAALARQLHTTASVVCAWQRGRQLPQLENLVRLSTCVGSTPARLLTDPEVTTTLRTVRVQECRAAPPPPTRRRCRRLDWEAVAATVREILTGTAEPPLSIREVSRRLGIAVSQLRVQFPTECQTISARYQGYVHERSRRRLAQIDADIRQAVLQIHAAGDYPTLKRVAQMLPTPGVMRAPEARATWHAAVGELGWMDEAAAGVQRHTGTHKMEA